MTWAHHTKHALLGVVVGGGLALTVEDGANQPGEAPPSSVPAIRRPPSLRPPPARPKDPPPCERTEQEVAAICGDAFDDPPRATAFAMLAERTTAAGERVRLPFSDLIPDTVRPEAVEAHVEAWSSRCLEDGAFLQVNCREYPCAVAADRSALRPGCVDALNAASVTEMAAHVLDVVGDEGHVGDLDPLLVGVFRFDGDQAMFGSWADDAADHAAFLAFRPWFEASGHPAFGAGGGIQVYEADKGTHGPGHP